MVGLVAGLALAGVGAFLWNASSAQKAAAQAQAPRGDQRPAEQCLFIDDVPLTPHA